MTNIIIAIIFALKNCGLGVPICFETLKYAIMHSDYEVSYLQKWIIIMVY